MDNNSPFSISVDLLNPDFFSQDKVLEISDLVNFSVKSKFFTGILSVLKKKNDRNEFEMKLFLFERIKVYLEDDVRLSKLNSNRIIGLYVAITSIYSLYEGDELRDNQIYLEVYLSKLTNKMRRDLIDKCNEVVDMYQAFDRFYRCVLDDYVLPLDDLAGFLDDRGCIHADLFVEYVNHQMKVNFEHLGRLELMKMRRSLSDLSKYISTFLDHGIPNLYTQDFIDITEKIREETTDIKDILIELQYHLSGHVVQVQDILANYGMEGLESSHLNVYEFFQETEESIEKYRDIWEGDDIPSFPISIPNIIDLQENIDIEIQDENQLKIVREKFRVLISSYNTILSKKPDYFPYLMPNLSTYDGLPDFYIKDMEDFILIYRTYLSFFSNMTMLSGGWSLLLQTIFDYIDITDVFCNADARWIPKTKIKSR
eukprot:TRINITY_DN12241_c0_g1_i1.p1 TRINITY_DN12241_c0_g1~~TRINITY_DN12241_c0_g1_i1.p1  ORF type:complete len:427 (-),score=93.42 TRINITY_DN12241_c0_g1_i1:235-1515(-)